MAVNADKLVQIVPRVISAGTSGLTFGGLLLSRSSLLPSGRVVRFASAQAVADYFGSQSEEARAAALYFQGYTNTAYLPSYIYFAAYTPDAVSAWLRGAAYEGTLADLKLIRSGTLRITIDGIERIANGVDFYTATSFSDCAQRLQTALSQTAEIEATAGSLTGAPVASVTALKGISAGKLDISIDGAEQSLTALDFSAVNGLSDVATVLDTALEGHATVTVSGSSLVITSDSTGDTSTVSYASDPEPSGEVEDLAAELGLTQAVGAVSVAGTDAYQPKAPTVTYDSQTQAFQITSGETGSVSSVAFGESYGSGVDLSQTLNLTEQAGAVQSVGTDGESLTDTMANVLKYARDWVSFSTIFEPVYAEKIELAQWCASWDTRFLYVLWDTDNAARVNGSTISAGYAINHDLALDGTCCVYNSLDLAASVMGAVACLNFNQLNGRTTLAYRQFEGVTITCDDDEDYDALVANGYNCYADFATAANNFRFFQNGQVSGRFEWADSYLNAIAMKDSLQLNILDLFAAVRSLPYNEDGFASIRTACLDTINKFLNFGAIRTGISLSQTQKVQLLQEVGKDISQTLETVGWYMQITDPGATVRGQRETPNCLFYYMDGGSIQKIVMPATCIQ